jgi:hypothetical protein
MEALTPPERLERAVLALIPPCAREAVAGDLCETYRDPRQYVREALRTVPHVVVSQMRRNLNLPLLLLQAALVWWLLGTAATALAVPVLMLREAWRPLARPDATQAIRVTMAVALLAMVFVQHLSFDNDVMRRMGLDHTAWTGLYFFGFLVAPLLCLLRTGLIVGSDRPPAPPALSRAALAQDYLAFMRRGRRRALAEAVVLFAAALCLWQETSLTPLLAMIFALTGAWLAVHCRIAAPPPDADFVALRARYREELYRRQQMRRFLWVLWFAPLLLLLHERAMRQAHPIPAMTAAALLVLLAFLVSALIREQAGRAQEDIGALERMREAASL